MQGKALRITTLAAASLVAFCMTFLTQYAVIFPALPFLFLDLKSVIIVICGYLFGPFSTLYMTVVVAFIEMFTISRDGLIGLLMNIISTGSFVFTATFFYSRKRTMRRAEIGLVLGVLLATAFMLIWNYIMVPIYQGVPRHVIAAMLIPYFLPFNLIKFGTNAILALAFYKPIANALRKAKLLPAKNGTP